ncbi:MAG: hypothetical protein GIW99_03285, partial [Candidatus Eremiobacteraeota bacterium]|nr:hypothetical protein [Candidatus Eremiobacteraeota bacterium]
MTLPLWPQAVARRRRLAGAVASAALASLLGAACIHFLSATGVAKAANATPVPATIPTLVPSPRPSTFHLTAGPWRLTPDGTWAAIVKAAYQDASGTDVPEVRGDVDFSATVGDVLGLVRRVYSDPAALVTLAQSRPVTVSAVSKTPSLGRATISLPAPPNGVAAFAVVAEAVGPHLINVGWTPLQDAARVSEYRVYRESIEERHPRLIAVVSPTGHAWRDSGVEPSGTYLYTVGVSMPGLVAKVDSSPVQTPSSLPPSGLDDIAGKGIFLYYAPTPDGDHGWGKLDPDATIAQARDAGITDIELRMAYGSFFEADTAAARGWVDRVLDGAAASGIKVLAWEVPRRGATDDVAEAVRTAAYHTANGNGFSGLALDIENGDDYMGAGEAAKQSMVDYIQMARAAVGPRYLLVATVISPHMTHWTNRQYPYARIAPYASVMQPMEYWHYHYATSNHDYTEKEIAAACSLAVSQTRRLAGRDVPINVAGQSVDIGEVGTSTATGVPSSQEITWSLRAS